MPIRGDTVRCDPGGHLGRLSKRRRRGHIAVLVEHHVDQLAGVSLVSQARTAAWRNDVTDQDNLGQITQGMLVAQTPELHEGDDVAGKLCPVLRASGPLVELFAAIATAKPAVSRSDALDPSRNGHRAAPKSLHLSGLPCRGPITHARNNRTRIVARTLSEPICTLDESDPPLCSATAGMTASIAC
jgi:hypothetical protein